jgi:transposase
MLASVRPRDDAGRTRRQLAADHIADVRALDRRLVELERRIAAAVAAQATSLTELYGVGPIIAARILGEVGCIDRFITRHRFATYTGTAPIEVSSGEVVRHRLSRAGNRRLNHVLHMMAISQLRADTDGRAYYRRKLAEGKTHKEALRCLKRRLSDAVYRQLLVDASRDAPRDDAASAATDASQGTAKPRAATSGRPALDGPTPDLTATPKMDGASRPRRLACMPSRETAPASS